MQIQVNEYDLPDISILDDENWPDYKFFTWSPERVYLILGQSNKTEKSLIIENVIKDSIKVYKRPSGGESVILTPNTLVISTLIKSEKLENPAKYFETANKKIIEILSSLGINNLKQKGISDIAIGEKKILGSSIYRKTNNVFYHAVLNISEETDLMEKYLAHPGKEPDYRLGRKHEDFVTSIHAENHKIESTSIAASF